MNPIIGIFIFLAGSSIGSFYKLVIDRYEKNESIVFGGSYCNNCKKKLAFWQNIPIFSYIYLSGKCYWCKEKLSIEYFLFEFITGFFTLTTCTFLFLKNVSLFSSIQIIVFIWILIFLSFFDYKYKEVPHQITYSSILVFILFLYFEKESFLKPIFNLGVTFLLMDIFYTFASTIKKIKPDENHIAIGVFIWSLISLFNQNNYLVIIPIAIFYLTQKIKLSSKKQISLWLLTSIFIIINLVKYIFYTYNEKILLNYFFGIGIIYLSCEIFPYYFIKFFKTNIEVPENNESLYILGGGDITLLALIGTVIGYELAFFTLFLASLLAIFSQLIVVIIEKVNKKEASFITKQVAFVPYLSLACFIIILLTK